MRSSEIDIEIDENDFKGFITVAYEACYENGECGYPGWYLDDWYIVSTGARGWKDKKNLALVNRIINRSKIVTEYIEQQCCEHCYERDNHYYDER